jgi:hypothetical protein
VKARIVAEWTAGATRNCGASLRGPIRDAPLERKPTIGACRRVPEAPERAAMLPHPKAIPDVDVDAITAVDM